MVLDTNLLVSAALLENSLPRRAVELALRKGEVLTSNETLAELGEVLTRKKFDRYVSEEKRLRFLATILQLTELVEITENIVACRDPKDDKFLALAVSGGAKYIVTGDADLLVLHPFRGVSVITPADFVDVMTAHSG